LKNILLGSAAFACVGIASGSANAQLAFGAGATFPQIAYRQLMDCMYNQAQGSPGKPGALAKATDCVNFNGSGFGGLMLYAPTGSGNGKATLLSNNKATIGTPSNSVPYTDSTFNINNVSDYDGVQFIGSDDILNATDVANWNAAGNPAKFGNIIQIPALVGGVGIGFQGKDGAGANLNILKATPTGGSSGLNLSRQALCGIVSGHITKWDNSILTALNGGTLGTGNITFVHRTDASGTTFLFSNALVDQCRYQFGPTNETNSVVVSYALPWTDHAGNCATPLLPVGANQLNWPDQFATDQCGNAVATPAGSHYANASGSGSLVALVGSTNGAMGYASADFWLPVKAGGLPAANLQNTWDLTVGTGQFHPPTFQGAQIAMSSAVPRFSTATDRANPLGWSLQGVVSDPVLPNAYPISGFTWIEMYQCYQVHANGINAFNWLTTWINYLYGSPNAHAILNANGFAELPAAWNQEAFVLLTDPTFGPKFTGTGGCSGKVGAY
jgi:ABC-type phosphate transport system substrate-binding protein